LVLGSSRTSAGLRPASLQSCRFQDGREPLVFNFALAGNGPIEEMLTWQRLRDAGIRPDYVLIEVLSPMMLYPSDTEPNVQARRMSWRDLALVVRYAAQPSHMCLGWIEAWSLPCYTHRSALLLRCCRTWETKRKRVEPSHAHYLPDGSTDNEGRVGAL